MKLTAEQKGVLDKINQDLVELMDIADSDFLEANRVVTLVNQNGQHEVDNDAYQTLIVQLQYADIFRQRIDHMITIHQQLVDGTMMSVNQKAVFHLQVFQVLTLEFDLVRTISTVLKCIQRLKQPGSQPAELYFVNANRIKTIFKQTQLLLLQTGGSMRYLPTPPLSDEQFETIQKVYSMEYERVVLRWFLETMPLCSWDELQQHYESSFEKIKHDNIELF